MNEFVPRHVILKSIELLGRCPCELCQKEKKKREDSLFQTAPVKDAYFKLDNPPEKEDSMQGVNEVEYWRTRCHDYEWMYQEQRDIAKGYKEINEELHAHIKKLNIEKAMQQQLLAKI